MLKPLTLALCCLVVCCCSVAGCLNPTSNQTTSNNQNSGLQDSRISLNVTSTAPGNPVSIPATITDATGRPLDGKVIEWFLDSTSLGKSQSSNGTTTLHLTSQYTGNLGNSTYYQLRVIFYGDDTYKSSTASSFLIVNSTSSAVQNSTTRP